MTKKYLSTNLDSSGKEITEEFDKIIESQWGEFEGLEKEDIKENESECNN